ncbi:MAG TPA: hypothetical protein VKE95_09200 [Burkholderiales bacterium]|nr:hypothetical protein [Burkholderiales bacterium]
MKRLLAAVALSSLALSASALEIGKPFEQLDIDRALPNIEFAPVQEYVAGSNAPFEQLAIDRALPNVGSRAESASVGSSQSAQSVWANDWNFIAPAL